MNIEKQIEFDKIKEKWMELAITDQAKDQIRNISFYLSELELRRRLKDTTDSRLLMEQIGMPPLSASASECFRNPGNPCERRKRGMPYASPA